MRPNFIVNVFIVCGLLSLSTAMSAQSDMDDRKFRFGLMAAPNLGWLRPNISELERDGLQSRVGFGYGVMMDYKFSDSPNYLLTTGFNVTSGGGGLSEPWQTVVEESDTSFTFNGANSRTYRMQYLTVPILLKMRTGDIGYMSYFGAIGFDLGFRTRARVDNDYTWLGSSALQPADENDLEAKNEINFLRLGLNVTLGAEYNLTGNTNVYAGIGFHNAFTNMFNGKDINRVLKPASNGSPELDASGNVIESQMKRANPFLLSLDVGVFFCCKNKV